MRFFTPLAPLSGHLESFQGTQVAKPSADEDLDSMPEGGLQAWTQVLASHLLLFNTWGYVNSYGVFQTYYTNTLHIPLSAISWIGSIQIFLLFFVSTLSGRLADAGYYRTILVIGSLLEVLGIFMTSLATRYWQLFLANGICIGLGGGLLFCPAYSLLSQYFKKRRALAFGVAACGSATGSLVFPGVVESLLPRVGFGWTLRTLGFIALGTQVIAIVLSRSRIPPRIGGPLVAWEHSERHPSLYSQRACSSASGVSTLPFIISAYTEATRSVFRRPIRSTCCY